MSLTTSTKHINTRKWKKIGTISRKQKKIIGNKTKKRKFRTNKNWINKLFNVKSNSKWKNALPVKENKIYKGVLKKILWKKY